MVKGGEDHIVSDLAAITQENPSVILKVAAGIDENLLPGMDILPEIGIKGREHPQRRIDRSPEKLRQQSTYLIRRMISAIQLTGNTTGLIAHFIHKTLDIRSIKRLSGLDVCQKFMKSHIQMFFGA